MRAAASLLGILLSGCTEFCGEHPLTCAVPVAVVASETVILMQRKSHNGPSCSETSGGANPAAGYCPPVPPAPRQ